MAKPLQIDQTHRERLKAEARAILQYSNVGQVAPSSLERQLRKLEGIKEIVINPISQTIKIRFNPQILSGEKIRAVLKKHGQDE